MAVVKRRSWLWIFAIVAGLVLGGLLGKLCEGSVYLWWLDYGIKFGFDTSAPVNIDIYILKLTLSLGLWFHINVASILGVIIACFLFRKL